MGIKVKQHDPFDCGAACLVSVCSYYKLKISIASVRKITKTDLRGTTILGIVNAAKGLGFMSSAYGNAQLIDLEERKEPVIVHVLINRQPHYLVVYKTTKTFVKVMDPSYGTLTKYNHEDFREIWSGMIIMLTPDTGFETGNLIRSHAAHFWSLIKPQKSLFLQVLFGGIIYTALGVSTSIYVQKITDYVIPSSNDNLLNVLTLIMIVIVLMQTFINFSKELLIIQMGKLVDVELILGYYKHIIYLPQAFFDGMRVGEIISRINDAIKIRSFINEVCINIFLNGAIVILSIVLMTLYSWKLALLMSLIIPLAILLYFLSHRINSLYQRKGMEASAILESQLVESINASSTIKRLGIEEYINEKTENSFIVFLRNIYQAYTSNSYIKVVSDLINKAFIIILLYYGTSMVVEGVITTGELFSFYSLLAYFTGPLFALIASTRQIQEAIIASDRLFEIMDLQTETESEISKVDLQIGMIGDITFKNVTFRYGNRAIILDDVSLFIPKGKSTAIIGSNGSGKSTIMNLLQNMYPIDVGNIHIGDYRMDNISNQSLRKMIGVVPQRIDLFAGTIIENITIGECGRIDYETLMKVCKQIDLLTFIEKQPNGFNSYIGENGVFLSGGQKQKIAIARALYRNPEVLLLDEPTSSLDQDSYDYVTEIIRNFSEQNKTIVVISHNLSNINVFDNIIVIDGGKVIVAGGTHEELMNNSPLYQEITRKN